MQVNLVKVLIIDDSALVRQVLTSILEESDNIKVVGTARDAFDAREKIKKLNPDVLTLDIEMPKMDGITFLKNLMRLRPMPVVMISSLTHEGADATLEALEIGAVDFVSKPQGDIKKSLVPYSENIVDKVLMAANAQVREHTNTINNKYNSEDTRVSSVSKNPGLRIADKIIAIGSSTGGTEAIKEILMELPVTVPAIIISQHIPAAFSKTFADRMNRFSRLEVYEAEDGQKILPGCVYIAPGGKHLLVKKSISGNVCKIDDGSPMNRHKPSVDIMFDSVAEVYGSSAMGIILTGMGSDGADGMLHMKKLGAYNISQDEESSVIWGMPGAAVKLGAVDKVLNLNKICAEIIYFASKDSKCMLF